MRRRSRILIIDDSDTDRDLYKLYLSADQSVDWCFAEAANAKDGLAAFRQHDDQLVLLDHFLPDRIGLDLLNDLKGGRSFAPVVLLTGDGSESLAVECVKNGAQDFLVKGCITPEALRRTVHLAEERIAMMKKIDEQRESLSVFARLLAHDLRAPIRHILNVGDMISSAIEEKEYEEVEKFRELLQRSGHHLQSLINTLAEYNKFDGVEVAFEQVSMDAVVRDVVMLLSVQLKERNARVTHDPLPKIVGNEPQLAELLQNLILNGIKFCESPQPSVHVGADELDGGWRFSVRDNGVGIPEQFCRTVFDPFKRLHSRSRYPGTGLGLAICRKIVDRHGGEIWCESEEGKGTTFYFTVSKVDVSDKMNVA